MVQRKESHLNTYFNIRKNKLKEITKENKQIYVRINSQKSLYSSRKLDNSSSSLSQSRCSNKSDTSFRSKKSINRASKDKRFCNSSKKKIEIVERNVDKLQLNEVSNYLRIFCNHTERNGQSPRMSYEKGGQKKEVVKEKGKENKQGLSGLEKIVEEYSDRYRKRTLLPKVLN